MPLANPRHERFAQRVASGESATAAYRLAYGQAKNADVMGPRLLGNVGVRDRVAELQTSAAKDCLLSIERRRELLARFAQNDAEKTADRIRALELDARLAGHLKGDSVTVHATAVSGYVVSEAMQAEAIARKREAVMRRLKARDEQAGTGVAAS